MEGIRTVDTGTSPVTIIITALSVQTFITVRAEQPAVQLGAGLPDVPRRPDRAVLLKDLKKRPIATVKGCAGCLQTNRQRLLPNEPGDQPHLADAPQKALQPPKGKETRMKHGLPGMKACRVQGAKQLVVVLLRQTGAGRKVHAQQPQKPVAPGHQT